MGRERSETVRDDAIALVERTVCEGNILVAKLERLVKRGLGGKELLEDLEAVMDGLYKVRQSAMRV